MKKLNILLSISLGIILFSSCSQHYASIGKVRANSQTRTTKKHTRYEAVANQIPGTENTVSETEFLELESTGFVYVNQLATKTKKKMVSGQKTVPATKYDMSHITGRKLQTEKQQITETTKTAKTQAGSNQTVAALLSFFLGVLGIDRFYLGYTGIGILKLLTFGVFGILALIDFIRILFGDLKPKDGEYTK